MSRHKFSINVNELNEIIRNHYQLEDVHVEAVDITGINNQFDSERVEVGYGGELTIYFEAKKKRGRRKK